ncbi:HGGxSTG domain-containing protein [Thetidibacter halocola]|uniref:HGGxSTG domain-containing protein n=1 Tax=Thetidibacter halocola TaxID=2827239 RepID=UPI003D1609BA
MTREGYTRKGTPCRLKTERGQRRCRFHGGCSTGSKTPEGKDCRGAATALGTMESLQGQA